MGKIIIDVSDERTDISIEGLDGADMLLAIDNLIDICAEGVGDERTDILKHVEALHKLMQENGL